MKQKSNKKKTAKVLTTTMTTDLGDRSLNKQHNNRTIVIPKVALENCGCDTKSDKMSASVTLVQEPNGENYIKVTPKKCKEVKN